MTKNSKSNHAGIQSPAHFDGGRNVVKFVLGGIGAMVDLFSFDVRTGRRFSARFTSVNEALRSDMARIGRDLRVVIAREKTKAERAAS
jgi:hypothetical protein